MEEERNVMGQGWSVENWRMFWVLWRSFTFDQKFADKELIDILCIDAVDAVIKLKKKNHAKEI